MQLRADQLESHLQRKLAPIYLLSGDEPLLAMEAADAIRAAARKDGYAGREVFDVDARFDWSNLSAAADSLSLFAEKRLLELRIPNAKPGDAGGKALRAYAERPPADTLLLVHCGRLDANAKTSKWVQALAGAGVWVTLWPVDVAKLPAWINARMRRLGLSPTNEATAMLAERVEGNLLACAQEIDKLLLLRGPGPIDADTVHAAVGDSARFGVFTLIDAVQQGDAVRTRRILAGLRAEGVDVMPVLTVLSRDLRTLANMALERAAGDSLVTVMARWRIWDLRQRQVGAALSRHRVGAWQAMLQRCARIDRMAKGQAPGNPWDELLQLALFAAGRAVRLPAAP